MNNRPVGIFDSGLGGLSALRVLRQLLPEENIVYFGDTGRNPYGVRSPEELRRMAREDMELAASFGAKAIIAACGTVSSTAPDVLASFRLPVFNVIDASVAALAAVPGMRRSASSRRARASKTARSSAACRRSAQDGRSWTPRARTLCALSSTDTRMKTTRSSSRRWRGISHRSRRAACARCSSGARILTLRSTR